MTRSAATNYTAAGSNFEKATAGTDAFKKEDVQLLAEAVDLHTHASTRGLQIPTAGVADLAVTTGKLADQAVTATKIAAGTIDQTRMGANSIATAAIQDLAVTTGKLADSAVSTLKLANLAITDAKVAAAAAIAQSKISNAVRAIDADKVDGADAGAGASQVLLLTSDASVKPQGYIYPGQGGGAVAVAGAMYLKTNVSGNMVAMTVGRKFILLSGALQSSLDGFATSTSVFALAPQPTPLTSTSYDGNDTLAVGTTLIDTSAVFGLPLAVLAVVVQVEASWAVASAASVLALRSSSGGANIALIRAHDTMLQDMTVTVPCDPDGDFFVVVAGATANNVIIRIWGYYL